MGAAASGRVGILANPMSGRDVRRMAARARRETPDDKQNVVARAVIGAAAAGAREILLVDDCFRICRGAVENLRIDARFTFLDPGALETRPADTARAARAMRSAGAAALVVLGGDGTNRVVARAWPDAPLIAISSGTNNVFPRMLEPTVAGQAAGLLASGAVARDEVCTRAKVVRVEYADGGEDLAVVDAVLLEGDHPGNLLPFEPALLRALVLARAEPAAVGMSPIGGLLQPCGAADDFGVEVRCSGPPEAGGDGRALLVPVSPGLFRRAFVRGAHKRALGEPVRVSGPGLLAFDGDRSRVLEAGEVVTLRVERDGPYVIDAGRALRAAAEAGVFVDRHFHDGNDGGAAGGCC